MDGFNLYFPIMSIAVSAVVKPSRTLFALLACMCIGVVVVGMIIATGHVGDWGLPARLSVLAICLFAAIFGFYSTGQTRKTHHIDISGIGQIRLVEHSALAAPSSESVPAHRRERGEVVSLMADSTLWPFLLLLRLKGEDRRISVLRILPDSVEEGEFRALSVACRWIAAHNNPAERKNL